MQRTVPLDGMRPPSTAAEALAPRSVKQSEAPRRAPAPLTPARVSQLPSRSFKPRAYDRPDEAQAFFLRKRLPEGETALPTERYFQARDRMAAMARYSTREGRLLLPQEAGEGGPDGATLQGWTQLGPGNIGGRTRALLLHPDNVNPALPNTMYAAGVAGGVWKTTNGGASWTALDDMMANLAVVTMAMDPTNPGVVYAGTGELFAGDGVRGAGIFKTTDGGATWSRLASTNTSDFHYVSKIVVSPNDPQRLYAATGTGVWRSTNGGATWTVILGPAPSAHCSDLAIRTDRPTDYLFAACGVLAQSTIYRNTDAGGSGVWDPVNEAGMGRTSLAIAPSNQNVVYAMSASLVPGPYLRGLHAVYRTTDGGENWFVRLRNTDPNLLNTLLLTNPYVAVCSAEGFLNQGSYDNVIAVDPLDPNSVWAGGIDLFRSDDGGLNWGMASHWWLDRVDPGNPRYAHADQHVIVFHPSYNGTTNTTMFVGNDGGLFRTDNARAPTGTNPCSPNLSGVNWTVLNNNYGVTQFYYGVPYPDGSAYLGGTQDNGTVRGSNATGPDAWEELLGGDGGAVAVDPTNTNVLYAEHFGLSIKKSTNGGSTFQAATNGITESQDNFEFIVPFIMDPTNPQLLWTGGRQVWRTDNGAALWASASPVLPGSGRVSAIAVTPAGGRRVLVGRSAGYINVGVSADGNTYTWSSFTQPRSGYVSSIGFHPSDPDVAYATYSTFGGTHVWKTTNGGMSWVGSDGPGAAAIPDIPCHSIVVDPSEPSRLYLGTDLGVFVSLDAGASWAVENTGFANVITESLVARGSDLFAFTHGRGAWRVGAGVPTLAINDVSVVEGNSGTTNAVFTVSLSAASAQTVTVNYATADGTATAGFGSFANPNAVTIPPYDIADPYPSTISVTGLTGTITRVTATITGFGHAYPADVDVLLVGPGGQKTLLMSDVGGGSPGVSGVNLTFDDAGPPLSSSPPISGTYQPTDIEGSVPDTFPGPAPVGPYTASLAAFNSTSPNGTWSLFVRDDALGDEGEIAGGWSLSISTTGGDYVFTSGSATFAPGATSQNVTVMVIGDTAVEPDETFFVNLSSATGATVADAQGQGTIINDDVAAQARTIQFVTAASSVGEAAGLAVVGVRVTTSDGLATIGSSSVNFSTANGTATGGTDYTPSAGTITFPTGSASGSVQNISVPMTSDSTDEVDETFTIGLSSPSNATLGTNTTHTVTIIDDDPPPSLSVGDVSVLEGNAGFTSANFALTLSPASGRTVTVNYSTRNGTATAPADYQAVSGSLSFNPGETVRAVTVAVNGDTLDEEDETFFLDLVGATGATITDAAAQATITDDDPLPSLSVGNASVTEGDVGTTDAGFSVTLSPASGRTVTVNYATSDGTATAPGDYLPAAGTLRFTAGETTKTVVVAVKGDTLEEPDETFKVDLTTASNAMIAVQQGVGTILDDDGTGLDFYTVTPCRLIDTRLPIGPGPPHGGPALSPGQLRIFALAGRCGISLSARAISVNVTATEGGAAGFVRLYPANETVPLVSTLNYLPGTTRGNNAIVGLSPIGELAVISQQAVGTVHLILDVNGYFE